MTKSNIGHLHISLVRTQVKRSLKYHRKSCIKLFHSLIFITLGEIATCKTWFQEEESDLPFFKSTCASWMVQHEFQLNLSNSDQVIQIKVKIMIFLNGMTFDSIMIMVDAITIPPFCRPIIFFSLIWIEDFCSYQLEVDDFLFILKSREFQMMNCDTTSDEHSWYNLITC